MVANDDLSIRPLRRGCTNDEERVVALVNKCYRGKENWTNESDIVGGLRVTPEQLRSKLETFDFYVAIDSNTQDIVASIQVGVTSETVAGSFHEPAGYMGMFAVSPAYQSRGLGSRLANFAEQKCKEKGMTTMSLDVLDVRNDIIKWYERRGYKRTGQSADAAPLISGKGEELLRPASFIVMVKDLENCTC